MKYYYRFHLLPNNGYWPHLMVQNATSETYAVIITRVVSFLGALTVKFHADDVWFPAELCPFEFRYAPLVPFEFQTVETEHGAAGVITREISVLRERSE